ncbi:MAG TPA: sulfite exporter TauE/SafE family protein [Phycisphaerales bacterium]|nr:sulfite exporter TauE/SafE family protein [Phycisphaerales bacterium]
MDDPVMQAVLITGIGLVAGLVGGLTGLGGSVVMLPGLALFVGFHDPSRAEQHTYQAAAMAVNFLVAVPATWRHSKAGAIRPTLLVRLLPPAVCLMVAGVLLSNAFEGQSLIRILAAVIAIMVIVGEISHQVFKNRDDGMDDDARIRRATPAVVGTGVATGLLAGLLGIGGGVITVVSLQTLGRIPIKQAIAGSTATMCLMAPVGAGLKMMTLSEHGQHVIDAVKLVGLLGPAAICGSLMGASLVHRLPISVIRPGVAAILLVAAAKLGGVI